MRIIIRVPVAANVVFRLLVVDNVPRSVVRVLPAGVVGAAVVGVVPGRLLVVGARGVGQVGGVVGDVVARAEAVIEPTGAKYCSADNNKTQPTTGRWQDAPSPLFFRVGLWRSSSSPPIAWVKM